MQTNPSKSKYIYNFSSKKKIHMNPPKKKRDPEMKPLHVMTWGCLADDIRASFVGTADTKGNCQLGETDGVER
jgi:hypothetical protein